MKELVLDELKIYADEINSNGNRIFENIRLTWFACFASQTYSKKKQNPLLECSEYYLDDKDFIKSN